MPPDIFTDLDLDATPESGSLFVDLVARHLEETRAGRGPVSTALSAKEIAQRFDEPLPHTGKPLREVVERVERDALRDANHLTHPMYMGHQVSAPLAAALWTEPVISVLNNSLAVREMAPTLTAIETRIVRWMTELAGFGSRAGGTLTTGGTEATFTALLAARARAIPDAWERGIGADTLATREIASPIRASEASCARDAVTRSRCGSRCNVMAPRGSARSTIICVG